MTRPSLLLPLIALCLWLALFPAALLRLGNADAQHTLSPAALEATLRARECTQQQVTLSIGAAPSPQLDVALIIDATGSLKPALDDVRANAESMIANIRRSVADTHFAVATFSDYPQVLGPTGDVKFGEAGDYPWRVERDFSSDVGAIRRALDGIRALGGGDQPEAYLRALDESTTLNWRPQSRRIAVLFGDNQPHEPDPGRDKTVGTADDIWRTALTDKLRRLGISVLAIYTRDLAVDFYEEVAAATGGKGFSLSASDRASLVIERLIEQDLQSVRNVTIQPAAAYQSWVSWAPRMYDRVPIDSEVDFAVRICLDSAAVPGSYQFPLDFIGSGVQLARLPVIIQLPAPGTATPPPTPTLTATPTPTPSATSTATATVSPTPTPTTAPVWGPPLPRCDSWWCCPIALLPLLFLPLLLKIRRPPPAPAPQPVKKPTPPQLPSGRPVPKNEPDATQTGIVPGQPIPKTSKDKADSTIDANLDFGSDSKPIR